MVAEQDDWRALVRAAGEVWESRLLTMDDIALALAQGGADAADETPRRAVAGIAGQPPAVWYCRNRACRRFLGRVYHGRMLVEPNGDTSGLPCKRTCPKCGRVNVRKG